MKFLILLLSICSVSLLRGVKCVTLIDIDVPSMVIINSEVKETIILDCHYDLEENTKSFVVKWFKNNQAIYQWIRGQNPSAFPLFKDAVDDTYQISSDPNQQYRALALVDANIDTSGVYKCVVQADESTQSKEKGLQIIDIKNYTLNLNHQRKRNETHLECTVDKVYPEPTIHLTTDDDDIITVLSFNVNENENGLFNATSFAVVEDDDEDLDSYKCTVSFQGFSLNLTTTVTSGYYMNKLPKTLLLIAISFLVWQ